MRDPSRRLRVPGTAGPSLARGLAAALAGLALLAAGPSPSPSPSPGPEIRQDLDTTDLLASALARALQTAYDLYAGSAAPLPEEVHAKLEAEYGAELARARFAVSPEAVRLLEAFDRFQGTRLGKGMHALTIDDLILLAADPAETESPYALWIWAHELHHVQQYRERGSILAFARDYLLDCEALERAADERANRALGMDVSVNHCLE